MGEGPIRTLSPVELHARLEALKDRFTGWCEGTGTLSQEDNRNILQWLEFTAECSTRRLALMRSMLDEVGKMGYPKSAETMIEGMIENWLFEGDEKERARLFEGVRRSVVDKSPASNPQLDEGVRLATDDKPYHRTEWGTLLGRKQGKVATGKAAKQQGPRE